MNPLKARGNTPALIVALFQFVICWCCCMSAMAQVPDFTAGGVPTDTNNINLGPTGMQGWLYHEGIDSSLARQIQVTSVAVGSPADGILAVGDVILGVDGTGATPVAFTSDARIALGMAIGDAEANSPATLKLLRWRAGVTETVEITLQTLGAYSATAPYNCPKSALILENGLAHRTANEDAGNFGFGTLALLAGNDPSNPANAARQALAQAEAHALIATQEQIDFWKSGQIDTGSKITWNLGHKLVVLAEYYLQTSDPLVLPTIEAMAVQIANGQSHLGTMGHQLTNPNAQGALNDAYNVGYGTVNSAGMPTFLGLLLAKQCGLTNPEIAPAIQRASRFYAAYTGYGAHPYGEHEPYRKAHEANGKSGLASLCFELLGDRAEDGKFYSMMATAASSERENGHTGAYFNQLWAPLGAAAGGEEAVAAYFSRISWMLDLNREWDGGFYWNRLDGSGTNERWSDFDMSTAALLTYALPLRELHITGRGHDSARYLTSQEVADACAADDYDATTRTISDLVMDLGNWSPKVQLEAANEIGLRTAEHATLVPQLIAIANDTQAGESRVGACFALGEIGDGSAAADLAGLLDDADDEVRYASAEALRYLPQADKLAQVDTILTAAASTGKPFFPIDEEDPMHFAHARLSMLLFYSGNAYGPKGVIWGSGINGVDRTLLYPAIKAVAATPFGQARGTLGETYVNLTYDDVLALSGAILDSITVRAPADKMFSGGVRTGGVEAMEMYDIADGVQACMKFIEDAPSDDNLQLLGNFGAGVLTVEPDPDVVGFLQSYLVTHPTGARLALDTIATDINPLPLTALKTVQQTTADDPILDLPATSTVLRVTAMDHAQGDSIYTWNKVFGPGAVTFTPNGTAAAANSTVQTDGTPGAYEFEVTMSDSRGLTESYGTVVVLVSDGSAADTTAPPATDFATAPTGTSISSITMTAQVVTDPEGNGVKYYFTCTSGGGNDSGWQTSPTYTDTGLLPDTTYEYTVAVRDLSVNQNTSAVSPPSAGSTLGLPTSTLSEGVFHILGSSNAPTSNTAHNVSVNGAYAGFQGQGNVGSVTVPVDETFNGTIVDYAFIRESATPDVIETYVDGGAGRITYGSYLPRTGSALSNSSSMKLWTATDPGSPAYSNPADFTSSTSVGSFDNINGSIDISGVTVGSVYFFYSGYRSTPFFSATMKDVEMVVADVPLPVFGDGDAANNGEDYVCSLNFVNNDGCDTIDWSLTSSLYSGSPLCNLKGIVLVTSTGQTATVPNVVGLTQTTAQNSIKSAGFTVGSVLLRSSSTVPAGNVISQSPGNGSTAIKTSAVNLVVSNGLPTTAVPNVIGLEQSIAESQIVTAGLVVGNVTAQFSATVSAGDVISQSPSSGSLLVFGGSVDLVVAANSPPVANDDSVTVDEGSSVGITLTATDPDIGDTLTYAVVAGPTNGVLSGTAPNLTYTPNGNYNGPDSFTFKATDDSAVDSNIATISITVNAVNNAPVFAADPINGSDATEDSVYAASIAGSASDDDAGASLSYAKVSGPAWLSVAVNGTLSGMPTNSDVGANVFTVSVTDSIAAPVNATLNITVINTNDAPVFTVDPIIAMNAHVDSAYSGTIAGSASDEDAGANLVYVKVSGPAWMSVATDGTLSGMPVISDLGINTFTVSVTDGIIGAPVEATLEINVTESGSSLSQAAFFIVASQNAPAANLNFDVSVYDGMAGFKGQGNVGSLSVAVDEVIPGAIVDYRFINESSTPDVAQTYSEKPGSEIISEIVLTGIGSLVNSSVADLWTVSDPGVAYSTTPDFSSATLLTGVTAITGSVDVSSLTSGTIYFIYGAYRSATSFDAVMKDTDGLESDIELLGFGADDFANNMEMYVVAMDFTNTAGHDVIDWTFDSSNGRFMGVIVTEVFENNAPVFAADPFSTGDATEDSVYVASIAGSASDADTGDTLVYAKVSGPAWLTVASNGDLSGTPTNSDVGANAFTVSVTDNVIATPLEATLNITVTNTNDAPVFAANPINGSDATEDAAYTATIAGSASDEDTGATLVYAKVSGPAWLTVASNGDLSGTPTNSDVGANAFTVSVTDNVIATPLEATLNITVTNTNDAPVFAANPINGSDATEDAAYASTIAGSAADIDPVASLTYAKVSGPAWLTVASNGDLRGTPSNGDVGSNAFTVSVTDGIAAPVNATLNITVINTNDAPVFVADPINGSDATEDAVYTSTIAGSATDDDSGASLAYAKVSGAAWLIVAADGTLSGTPTNSDVGLNVFTVSVTDGIAAPVNATLNITVDATTTTVPNVIGLAQATAEGNIVAANLLVGTVSSQNDAVVSAGDVISQSPTGGASAAIGSSVDLVVSLGPVMTNVPNVVGLAQATAEANIVAANLVVGSLTSQYDETIAAGSVVSQNPTGGSSVAENTNVDLVISLGPASSPKLLRMTVAGVSNTAWTAVSLGQTYTSAVIVATPIYPIGVTTPVVTRISNVTATGFDLKVDRADGLSGAVSFNVSVLAIEEGVYTQASDGATMEAVKYTSTITASGPNNWVAEARSYQNSYTNPVVIGQVMSSNDSNWSVFWSMGLSRTDPADAANLNVGKHVGQDPNTNRANETIGYIVIESGNGTMDGVAYEAGLGADIVQCFGDSATPYSYSLSGSLGTASVAVVSQAGMDGNDGAWAVLSGSSPVTTTSLGLHLAEDSLKDSRQRHTSEQVGYLVFE